MKNHLRTAVSALIALKVIWAGLPAIAIDSAEALDAAGSGRASQATGYRVIEPRERSKDEPTDHQYARDRKIDISYLAIDVTPDFRKRTVEGQVVLTFKPIGKPLDELRLDGIEMDVSQLTSTAALAGYQVTDKEIIVSFARPLPVGAESSLTIKYSAKPIKGMYFRAPSNGYPADEIHLFTQGETIEGRHWFPCYDYPNMKFRSEVTCHVPQGMTVISNGKQVSSKTDDNGLLAVRWVQDKPHVNYLICLVAGKFNRLEDKSGDVPLSFYTLASDSPEAQAAFQPTASAVKFFEEETGVRYPWAKYAQVVLRDFTQVGMENTSLTTLGGSILYPEASADFYAHGGIYAHPGGYKSEVLLSHELAHQWFGDLVTCKDWSHVWLNEGFATYYSFLFAGHRHGRDEMLYCLYSDRSHLLDVKDEQNRPIVFRRYEEPGQQFDYRAYGKGAWVVHMLRSQLGEELFRRCIKTYLEKFEYETVVTEDLNSIVEKLSGRSFDRFFDQWVYHSGIPELSVSYSWDENEKLARISVNQEQKISDQNPVFRFPLALSFKTKSGIVNQQVEVKEKDEDFYIHLDSAPLIVRLDPNFELLAKINVKLPTPLLYAQLADQSDAIGRVLAAEQLAGRDDEKTLAALKKVLLKDPFWGARARAAESLRKTHTDEALDILVAALDSKGESGSKNQLGSKRKEAEKHSAREKQSEKNEVSGGSDSVKNATGVLALSDPRARDAVIRAIGKFYSPVALRALLKVLSTEKNPALLATAIGGLAPYHSSDAKEMLLKYLNSESYKNRLADAAIAAMRDQDDPSYIDPLKNAITDRESGSTSAQKFDSSANARSKFTSHGLAAALETLGFLTRNEVDKTNKGQKDEVREFIRSYLSNKRVDVQVGAIRALGALEDWKSLALLETYSTSASDTPQRSAAEHAIAKIYKSGKPADNLSGLRDEILELKSSQRKLKKEFEDLQKRLKAAEKKATPGKDAGKGATEKANSATKKKNAEESNGSFINPKSQTNVKAEIHNKQKKQ